MYSAGKKEKETKERRSRRNCCQWMKSHWTEIIMPIRWKFDINLHISMEICFRLISSASEVSIDFIMEDLYKHKMLTNERTNERKKKSLDARYVVIISILRIWMKILSAHTWRFERIRLTDEDSISSPSFSRKRNSRDCFNIMQIVASKFLVSCLHCDWRMLTID